MSNPNTAPEAPTVGVTFNEWIAVMAAVLPSEAAPIHEDSEKWEKGVEGLPGTVTKMCPSGQRVFKPRDGADEGRCVVMSPDKGLK